MSRTVSFQPLLFGGDINVYSVARAFHEAYGVKSVAFGKFHTFPCAFSSIIDYRTCPDNEDPAVFLSNVEKVALEFSHKTVIVLGCGDSYVQLCAHLKDQFPRNVVAPYIDGALLDRLINKEHFYELCDQHGIDHPATFIYDGSMGHDFTLPFGPPYVAKPADSVAYWEHEFEGVKKVFICQTWEELLHALDLVYASGYPDHMVIQEFIPGDDTYMRVMTNYSDRSGQVKLMCLGHVLLEEHSPHGIGFEINCRQGRSNYYVTGAGYNIAKLLVEDRIEHRELPFVITKNHALWRMVPKKVAFKFIPKAYHPQMKALIRAGASTHSLEYHRDYTPARIWRVWKTHIGNMVRFDRHNKVPEN